MASRAFTRLATVCALTLGLTAATTWTARAEDALAKVKAAETQDEASAKPCTPHRRHRHAAACHADTQTAAAEPKAAKSAKADAAKDEGGGYMIQVGAYKNQGQAKDHLDTVAGDFGRIVHSASAGVEHSSGNYRVRFRGFSEKQAKAACHAMAAKGEKCMVMAAS